MKRYYIGYVGNSGKYDRREGNIYQNMEGLPDMENAREFILKEHTEMSTVTIICCFEVDPKTVVKAQQIG